MTPTRVVMDLHKFLIGQQAHEPIRNCKRYTSLSRRCEDRVAVFHHDARTVVVVADGAGGIGRGTSQRLQ